MINMSGKFIVIEGIDGSGKGTIATILAEWIFMRDKIAAVLLTREPTQFSEAGKKVRQLLKCTDDPRSCAREFAELYVADRKWNVKNRILPIMEAGGIAISDRYKHSTLAYQQLQGMNFDELVKMHGGLPVPDITIILDIPAEVAIERVSKDSGRDYMEVFEKLNFIKELRTKYLELPQKLPNERIVVIDASGEIKKTFEAVKKEVETILR